jgi:hypothetical protein
MNERDDHCDSNQRYFRANHWAAHPPKTVQVVFAASVHALALPAGESLNAPSLNTTVAQLAAALQAAVAGVPQELLLVAEHKAPLSEQVPVEQKNCPLASTPGVPPWFRHDRFATQADCAA